MIIDYVELTGKAGQARKPTHNFILYTGRKLANCEVVIRDFTKSTSCLSVALLKSLDKNFKSIEPVLSFCVYCTLQVDTAIDLCDVNFGSVTLFVSNKNWTTSVFAFAS